MNSIEVHYDGATRPLRLPDCEIESASRASGSARPAAVDRSALGAVLDGAHRLLVVVNDAYRPTPTPALLVEIADLLRAPAELRLVVATGMHPAPPDRFVAALTRPVDRPVRATVHDARVAGTVHGVLADGSCLELNPLLDWADQVLLIGSVEPHFFAGFTGGAKQLMPGLATRATIEANHRYATSLDCRPCRVVGNPVAAGIRETAERFADRLASLQAVATPGGWETFCGREAETFAAATSRCREVAGVWWSGPLDLLIAVVEPPLDRNLYQLQKGFENHLWAVRDGGALLLISACREGVGNDFFAPLARRYPHWDRLPRWEDQSYSLGLHKLYRTARARSRVRLYLHSTRPEAEVQQFYFEPVTDLDAWLAEHISAGMRVGLVHDAAARVSNVENPGDSQ